MYALFAEVALFEQAIFSLTDVHCAIDNVLEWDCCHYKHNGVGLVKTSKIAGMQAAICLERSYSNE